MDMLADRPRCVLGRWPTPIRRLERTSEILGVEVFAKLESESGAWGGNKVRKLEYVLPTLRDKVVVTHGAGTSSWASAVAFHAAPLARRVHVGLAGPVPRDLADLYRALGTVVHASSRLWALPMMALRARLAAGRGAAALPTGGSGLPGDFGSAWAGREVAAAVAAGDIPTPAEVIVPCGSAGTAAGLAVGMGLGGLASPVVAVRVTPRPLGTAALVRGRIRRLLGGLATGEVGDASPSAAPVVEDGRWLGPGYGKQTRESSAAIEVARRDGLELDPVYAAKAFAALLARAEHTGGPLLFVHTSPGPVPRPATRN